MSECQKEDVECRNFHQWLEINHIPHTHVANESRSGKQDAMIRAKKNKELGTARGVWDYEIFVPIRGVFGAIDAYQQIKIEMKRQKGGVVSEEQKRWGEIYEMAGVPAKVCHGCDEAVDFVRSFML